MAGKSTYRTNEILTEEALAAGGMLGSQWSEGGAGAPAVAERYPLEEETARTQSGRAPIGAAEVRKAADTMRKYKDGKHQLEKRVIDNEQWYKLRHWGQVGHSKNPGDPEPASAWLLNSIANKHADAMDNYPQPNVLPREEDDKQDAELLSSILPTLLEQSRFEQTYSDVWWYKLKSGTGVYGVFWNPSLQKGLGDVDIHKLDLLNLFWEPGVCDIQKSRNLYIVDLADRELLAQQYPQVKEGINATLDVAKYVYDDNVDTNDKVPVVDWYYKLSVDGREVLHYCKFVGDTVLYASENEPEYAETGFYDHGKYPVVFDTLFPVEGSPAGFGYVDVCKSPQIYIDKLDQVIIKSAVEGARPRWWVRGDGQVNEAEYADQSKDFVHYNGSGNPNESIFPITPPAMNAAALTVRTMKVDELKETSGNRDFNQGSTASGITAASAIAALQEAGSKLSRDIIKRSYTAFEEIGYLVIDLVRQFYEESRWFRVVGKDGEMKFIQFSGQQIAAKGQGNDFGLELGLRVPIFDLRVTAQKASPFSTVAQNERAKELYGMGFFRPDLADQALAALDMMQFDGIENVRERIAQNGTLYQQVQQTGQLLMVMAQELDALTGSGYTLQVQQMLGQQLGGRQTTPQGTARAETVTNAVGEAFSRAKGDTASSARAGAARTAAPKV